ncbi:hypothetical protein MTP99_005877 [Tenebrio molitor]|nr:hypothetical protein MTP99_005877 [Tenebrio molitor]
MMIDQYVIVTVQRDRLYRVSRELDEERQLDIVYGLLRKAIHQRSSESPETNPRRPPFPQKKEPSQPRHSPHLRDFGYEINECCEKRRNTTNRQTAPTTTSVPTTRLAARATQVSAS